MSGQRRADRVETVLLDAGGVLLDIDYPYLRSLLGDRGHDVAVEALSRAEADARVEIEERVRAGGRTRDAWRDYFRIILRRVGVPEAAHEGFIDELWRIHLRLGLWTAPVSGAVDAVRRLRDGGYRLGVVSNAEGRVEQDLRAAGFDGLLDTVIDSHVVGIEKPDPAIFRIALERLGSDASSAVFVGDVPSVDVAGARAAGIVPILLDRHDLYPEVGVPRLRSIGELPGWLRNHASEPGTGRSQNTAT